MPYQLPEASEWLTCTLHEVQHTTSHIIPEDVSRVIADRTVSFALVPVICLGACPFGTPIVWNEAITLFPSHSFRI